MLCNGESVLCLDCFMFQTSVLLTLCVIFQVQLSFPVYLLNVFLARLPNFSLNLLLFQWLQLLLVWSCISYSMFNAFLLINSCIVFFSAPSCMTFLSTGIATSISMHVFSCLFLHNYYIWPIGHNFSIIIIIIITATVVIVITTTHILWQYQLFTVICLHSQFPCISVFVWTVQLFHLHH